MSTEIHPTAIIEPGAELEAGVTVGAYAYIGACVKIRKGTEVMHHATVDGLTTMGKDNEVHPEILTETNLSRAKVASAISLRRRATPFFAAIPHSHHSPPRPIRICNHNKGHR